MITEQLWSICEPGGRDICTSYLESVTPWSITKIVPAILHTEPFGLSILSSLDLRHSSDCPEKIYWLALRCQLGLRDSFGLFQGLSVTVEPHECIHTTLISPISLVARVYLLEQNLNLNSSRHNQWHVTNSAAVLTNKLYPSLSEDSPVTSVVETSPVTNCRVSTTMVGCEVRTGRADPRGEGLVCQSSWRILSGEDKLTKYNRTIIDPMFLIVLLTICKRTLHRDQQLYLSTPWRMIYSIYTNKGFGQPPAIGSPCHVPTLNKLDDKRRPEMCWTCGRSIHSPAFRTGYFNSSNPAPHNYARPLTMRGYFQGVHVGLLHAFSHSHVLINVEGTDQKG